jgi:hypothetical protein
MNMNLNVRPASYEWLKDEDAFIADYMRRLGFHSLRELLPVRVFDLLNMNGINAIKAGEIIIALYQYIHPEMEDLDEAIYNGIVDQTFDFATWIVKHPFSQVKIRDLVCSVEMNREAIYDLYDLIKRAFWYSDEYDWHRYKYRNAKEYYASLARKKK